MTTDIIRPFDFEGQQVRTLTENDSTLFVASDIAKLLGYRDAEKLTRSLDHDEKGTRQVGTPSGTQNMTVLTEPGLFKAINTREVAYVNDPEAKDFVRRFQRWVNHEVLPSIRQHGAYMTPDVVERTLTDPDYLIRLATTLKTEKEARLKAEALLVEQQPRVVFAQSLEVSGKTIPVKHLANILRQNGIDIGQNRMFVELRDMGYLSKRHGDDWNMPTQRSLDMSLFEIETSEFINSAGVTFTKHKPVVTVKGQQFFINKYLKAQQEVAA